MVFFDLFLFATGYKVGPQFFRGLKKNALSQARSRSCSASPAWSRRSWPRSCMGYDTGTAAGLMAGAFTESTVIGTAGNTIDRLELPAAEKTRLLNNIPVAYAVSYLVGTGFVVWFLSASAPRLLRVDLKAEAGSSRRRSRREAEPGGGRHRRTEWDIRAFRLSDAAAGRTVADVERSAGPARVFVERIRRGAEFLEAAPDTVLRSGDVVAIGARRRVLLGGSCRRDGGRGPRAPRLSDGRARRRGDEAGGGRATLADVAAETRPRRGPRQIGPRRRGDSLRRRDDHQSRRPAAAGRRPARRGARGREVGYIERPSSETDVVFLGLGIVVGGLIGR